MEALKWEIILALGQNDNHDVNIVKKNERVYITGLWANLSASSLGFSTA